MEMGNSEKAEVYFKLAKQNSIDPNKLIWLPVHWGTLLDQMGRTDESLSKFAELESLQAADPRNKRALYFGLVAYADAMNKTRTSHCNHSR